MSSYYKLGSLIEGLATTATTGGTTTLTAASRPVQQFTGSAAQTVVLPDATTLVVPRRFDINNRSSGTVTVQDGASGVITTVPAGSQRYFLLTDNSSVAGVWKTGGVASAGSAGVTNADKIKLLTGMGGLNLKTDNIVSKALKLNPEEVGGNYWVTKCPLLASRGAHGSFSVNGFGYTAAGYTSTSTNVQTMDRFDNTNNYWLSRASTPSAARIDPATFILNSFGYLIGGDTGGGSGRNSATERYSDSTNTWLSKTSFSPATDEMFGFSVGGYGITGGGSVTDNVGLTAVRNYSDATDAWSSRASLPALRAALDGTGIVLNGFGYTTGGYNSGYQNTTYKYSDNSNIWITLTATTATSKGHASAGSMNGSYIYAAGNNGASAQTGVEMLNDSTQSWLVVASLSSGRVTPSRMLEIDSTGYLAGGGNLSTSISTVEQYVNFSFFNFGSVKRSATAPTSILSAVNSSYLASGTQIQIRTDGDFWKTLTSGATSVLKQGESISSKFAPASNIYTFGGAGSYGFIEFYNQNANSWISRLAITGANGFMSFSYQGNTYLPGGDASATFHQMYNELANTLTSKAALPQQQFAGAAYNLNGTGYAVAGFGPTVTIANNNAYNPTLDSWTSKTAYPAATYDPGSAALAGFGFIWSGTTSSNGALAGLTTNSYKYNDVADSWASITALPTAAIGHDAPTYENNYAFIFGLWGSGNVNVATTYKYDPALNSYATAANVITNSSYPGSGRSNGFLYSLGGYRNGTGAVADSAKYNPYANSWSSIANLSTARYEGACSTPYTGTYYNYEVRVGVPAYYAGIGGAVWATKTSMLQIKSSGGSFQFGSDVHCSDGSGGTQLEHQKYVTDLDFWIYETNFPYANQECPSMNLAFNGIGHRFGDGAAATNQLHYGYEPLSKVWRSLQAYPVLVYQQGAACLNSFLYGLAGRPGNVVGNSVYRYSDTSNSWTSRANALSSSFADCPGSAYNGFVYLTGLSGGARHDQYNDAADTWTAKTALSYNGGGQAMFLSQGRLVAAGGGGTLVTTTQWYNDGMDAWIILPSMPAVRGGAFNASVNDTGYIMGGGNGSGNTSTNYAFVPSLKNAVLGMALEVK